MTKQWTVSTVLLASATALICVDLMFSAKKWSKEEKLKEETGSEDNSNTSDVEMIIARRRTIKPATFLPDVKVPNDILDKMLEAANWAPSHGKTEPWRFVIFETKESISKLAELDAQIYKRITTSINKFQQHKYDKRIKSKAQSSHVIAICMKRQQSEQLPEYEELISVGMAVQNMHLVATKYNIGLCWTSGLTGDKTSVSTCHDEEMKKFLNLSEKDKCIGFLLIGLPNKKHPTAERKDIKDKVTWVR